ncbi:hypothetical protein ABT299_46985 [Spirillospora sp. NPDC000708]
MTDRSATRPAAAVPAPGGTAPRRPWTISFGPPRSGRAASPGDRRAEAAATRLLLQSVQRRVPARLGVRWSLPCSGASLTVRLPFRVDALARDRAARDFGVVWSSPPGGEDGGRVLRLSAAGLCEDEIDEGVARLVRFLEAEIPDRR